MTFVLAVWGGPGRSGSEQSRAGDTTPPVITPNVSGTLGLNGWYVSDVALTWTVSDPESAITSTSGCGPTTITTDTVGTTLTCSATSAGGTASASQSVTIKRDATAPTITYVSRTPPANGAGWNNGDVAVNWACADVTSGPVATSTSQVVSTEGSDQSATGTCTDNAGKSASDTQTGINIDKTDPTVVATASRTADHNGWYNHAFNVAWSAVAGDLSDSVTCDSPTPYSGPDTGSDSVIGHCTDAAGNVGSATFTFKYDATAPTGVAVAPDRPADHNGWYDGAFTATWSGTDATSTIDSCTATTYGTPDTASGSLSGTCTDKAGNTSGSVAFTFKYDATAPTIGHAIVPASPDGTSGWYKSAPTVTFSCADAASSIDTCLADGESTASKTLGESAATQSVSGTATDNAGNSQTDSISGLKVDLSDPTNVAFSSTLSGSYYWGSVPPAPTCTADDAISGLAGCVVTGYGTAVGAHTLIATATDNAGRTETARASYTVRAWTLTGFYSPVDMNGVLNTVKGGSTVPLKFEIFATTELTDVSAVASFKTAAVPCGTLSAVSDEIEVTTTGGTVLRYDSTSGQFIQNWQTPKGAGICYRATMTAFDGSSLVAYFKTK